MIGRAAPRSRLAASRLTARPARRARRQPAGATAAVAPFAAHRPIFDSGMAAGLSSAVVPLSGTGTPGAAIELRAVDGQGAPVTGWSGASIDAEGGWSSEIEVPLAASWLAPQIRVAGDPGSLSQGPAFGVGHVIAIWQQSEHHHLVKPELDDTLAPALGAGGDVEMWLDRARNGGIERIACRDDAPGMTSAMAAMADTLARARPGEKFSIVWHVHGGTSWNDLLDDDDPGRSWELDRALHDAATAAGQHVGLAWASWYAAPRGRGSDYVASLLPALLGVDETGAPAAHEGHEHAFPEIYGDRTRWLLSEPHRFDGDGSDAGQMAIESCRSSVRAGPDLPGAAGRLLASNIALTGYRNGEDDGAGGWTDWTHPSDDDPDGMQRLAGLTAGSILMARGLIPADVPRFDSAFWEPGGAYMELWDSAGALTTERLARGLPALDAAAAPHRTQVMGVRVNGAPAARAEIVAGRVRVHPPAGETFGPTDTVSFGHGGATGGSADIEGDLRAGIHLNLPGRDAGIPGVPHVACLPMPDPAVLANTLPAPALFSRSAAGPEFSQLSAGDHIGAGRREMTFDFSIRVPDEPASKVANVEVLRIHGLQLDVKLDMRPTRRGGRVLVVSSTAHTFPDGTFAYGAIAEITGALRLPTATIDGFLTVILNGRTVGEHVLAAGTLAETLLGNRSIFYVDEDDVPMDFGPLRIWWEAQASGAIPAGPPVHEIGPDLAAVNAHPWKVGPDAT